MSDLMRDGEALAQNIRSLQKDVRRMKWLMAGLAALWVVLVVVFWSRRHPTLSTEQVVAREFVLTDSNGNARARLASFPEGAGLEIYAPSGERRVELLGGGEEASLNLYIPVTATTEQASVNLFHNDVLMSSLATTRAGARLELHSTAAKGTAALSMRGTTASLTLNGAGDNTPKLRLESDETHACATLGGMTASAGASFCLNSPGLPSLEMADATGNRAALGIPQGPELSAKGSSAASMILKLKNGSTLRLTPH